MTRDCQACADPLDDNLDSTDDDNLCRDCERDENETDWAWHDSYEEHD